MKHFLTSFLSLWIASSSWGGIPRKPDFLDLGLILPQKDPSPFLWKTILKSWLSLRGEYQGYVRLTLRQVSSPREAFGETLNLLKKHCSVIFFSSHAWTPSCAEKVRAYGKLAVVLGTKTKPYSTLSSLSSVLFLGAHPQEKAFLLGKAYKNISSILIYKKNNAQEARFKKTLEKGMGKQNCQNLKAWAVEEKLPLYLFSGEEKVVFLGPSFCEKLQGLKEHLQRKDWKGLWIPYKNYEKLSPKEPHGWAKKWMVYEGNKNFEEAFDGIMCILEAYRLSQGRCQISVWRKIWETRGIDLYHGKSLIVLGEGVLRPGWLSWKGEKFWVDTTT